MKREEVLVILILLLFIQGYLFRNVFPAILAFSLVLYLLYLRSEFSPDIEAEWGIERKLTEGVKTKSRVTVKNGTPKKLWIRILHDSLPPGFKAESPQFILEKRERKEIDFFIVPVKGVYRLKAKIRAIDLRGLYFTDFYIDLAEIEVYPSLDKIKDEVRDDEGIRLVTGLKRALTGLHTQDLHSLRKFQVGDDTRHVEWKATARLGELIVKDFIKETESEVYLILDAGKEMRKGIKNSKIDYAATLTIHLAYLLKEYRLGLIVYDDYGVKSRVEPSKGPEQIEKIVKSLNLTPIQAEIIGVKLPETKFDVSREAKTFLRKIIPMIKGRKSFLTGLAEAIARLPSSAFLIFILDVTTHTNELIRHFSNLRKRHKILLLSPNPILFYDESKLDKDKLLWLYERYLEREELIKKFNRIVPTLDLGPSDLSEVIKEALK
ncbi:MAG: DUF58 domain-containing protein [Archaeoglobus sp.]|nr:DUF58 domain-containing protein [Archaeoglobus sp.]